MRRIPFLLLPLIAGVASAQPCDVEAFARKLLACKVAAWKSLPVVEPDPKLPVGNQLETLEKQLDVLLLDEDPPTPPECDESAFPEDEECDDRIEEAALARLDDLFDDPHPNVRRGAMAILGLWAHDAADDPKPVHRALLHVAGTSQDDVTIAAALKMLSLGYDFETSRDHALLLRLASSGSDLRRTMAASLLDDAVECGLQDGRAPGPLTEDEMARLRRCVTAHDAPARRTR